MISSYCALEILGYIPPAKAKADRLQAPNLHATRCDSAAMQEAIQGLGCIAICGVSSFFATPAGHGLLAALRFSITNHGIRLPPGVVQASKDGN